MAFNRIDDLLNLDIKNKNILVRVDFNVPVNNGVISDDTRLKAAIPTINALNNAGANILLLSHFGRPKGKKNNEMSLGFVAEPLSKLINKPVAFINDCIGDEAKAQIDNAKNNGINIFLLENTRFYEGEENNDPDFAAEIAKLGDYFVNDAFSAAHRAHASTEGVANILKSFAGNSMTNELDHLNKALGEPIRPLMAIVGGAKVSSKIDLLENLVSKTDYLVIGGGMANTFLAANGVKVGKSLCEFDLLDKARAITNAANAANCKIILPIDLVVSKEFKANAENRNCALDDVKDDEMILDAGINTIAEITKIMENVKTIIWNGPLGAFEMTPFDIATIKAAQKAAALAKSGALIAVAGGGDTVSALNHAGASDDFSFISTAGGAFLEWMEGKELPGVKVLEK